jgi:hypothetical protein
VKIGKQKGQCFALVAQLFERNRIGCTALYVLTTHWLLLIFENGVILAAMNNLISSNWFDIFAWVSCAEEQWRAQTAPIAVISVYPLR